MIIMTKEERRLSRQISMLEIEGFLYTEEEFEKLEDDFINKCGYSEEEAMNAAKTVLEYDKEFETIK